MARPTPSHAIDATPSSLTAPPRRPNPFTGARAANGSDWPRNGALLRGIPHEKDGKMYLEVNAIQQAGTEGFKDVRGQEKWMPSDGGSWNGGQWLHEPKE